MGVGEDVRFVAAAGGEFRDDGAFISIPEGVILPWGEPSGYLRKIVLPTLAKAFKFELNAPWGEHSESARHALLHGAPGQFKFQT